jgi:hypothetical protein
MEPCQGMLARSDTKLIGLSTRRNSNWAATLAFEEEGSKVKLLPPILHKPGSVIGYNIAFKRKQR